MRTSENITELCKALLGFHKQCGKIAKTAKNPFYKSTYADLPSILDAISEPLNNHGLAIVQLPDEHGITTRLMHESGEWIEATYNMPVSKPNDPQALGSSITYGRRYAIGAMLSLNIAEDDDGNAASKKSAKEQDYTEWLDALAGCKDKASFNVLYKSNEKVITADQKLFELFSRRATELGISKKQAA